MPDIPFSCECGALHGILKGASPHTGTHAACHCNSCRDGEIYSGAPDPAPMPVHIFQTSPHRIKISDGVEHLAAFSFGPTNLLRWRATCCGATLFNTPRNPAVSFVAIRTNRLQNADPIGPVVGEVFIPDKNGKARHKGLLKLAIPPLFRMISNRLNGRWKDNPFFDVTTRMPSAPITLVSKEERQALRN